MITGADWDIIIVGAGAAGCVLANRLTASGRYKVLVLEAGGSDNHLWIKVPAGVTRTMFDPAIGWGYENAPAPETRQRAIPCPRGRVIGGSSSINGHLYVRGQAEDYADWVAQGASGWGWDEVLPYFRRAETRAGGDASLRGLEGPLQVTDPRIQHPLCEAFISGMQSLGEPRNPDYNRGDQRGTGYYQYLIKSGRRWSAADAYLRPALSRANLKVETNAHVTRVVFEGRRAVGIEYRRGGSLHVARAKCEVILAGGSINSPQLLQLSGVGDAALLAQNGIGVVHAAPGVGENLVDHYAVRIASRVQGVESLNERTHFPRLVLEVLKYLVARRGVLASAVAHAYGFVSVASQAGRPDLQLLFAPASFEGGKMGRTKMETVPGMTCGVQQLRPLSRGHVRIQSNDPFSAPVIQPNYLKHDEDVATLVAGIRFMRRLYAAPLLARYVAQESWPGAAVESDTQIVEFARTTGSTVYHPVGTCRMGSGADAPVDPATLQVKGIVGLRVIDASVMPSMVSGNTYATTIMIAEKGADMVLSDQG